MYPKNVGFTCTLIIILLVITVCESRVIFPKTNWNTPFQLCGRRLEYYAEKICGDKVDIEFKGRDMMTISEECCKNSCTSRILKLFHCDDPWTETDYPPITINEVPEEFVDIYVSEEPDILESDDRLNEIK